MTQADYINIFLFISILIFVCVIYLITAVRHVKTDLHQKRKENLSLETEKNLLNDINKVEEGFRSINANLIKKAYRQIYHPNEFLSADIADKIDGVIYREGGDYDLWLLPNCDGACLCFYRTPKIWNILDKLSSTDVYRLSDVDEYYVSKTGTHLMFNV